MRSINKSSFLLGLFGAQRMRREAHKKLLHQSSLSSKSVSETSAWITLAILGSTLLITYSGETMLLPGIRDIIRDFHISYSTSTWILTAYLISGAIAIPIAGKLSDIYGRKKVILIIFTIYIIGIFAGGLSTNFLFLLLQELFKGSAYPCFQ
jgi:MFS family permease